MHWELLTGAGEVGPHSFREIGKRYLMFLPTRYLRLVTQMPG